MILEPVDLNGFRLKVEISKVSRNKSVFINILKDVRILEETYNIETYNSVFGLNCRSKVTK